MRLPFLRRGVDAGPTKSLERIAPRGPVVEAKPSSGWDRAIIYGTVTRRITSPAASIRAAKVPGHPYRRGIAQYWRFIAPIGVLVGLPAIIQPLGLPVYAHLIAPFAAVAAYLYMRSKRTTSSLHALTVRNGKYYWIKPREEYEHAVADRYAKRYLEDFGKEKGRRTLIRLYSPHELYNMMDMFPERRLMRLQSSNTDLSTWSRVYLLLIAMSIGAVLLSQCSAPPNISGIIPGGGG